MKPLGYLSFDSVSPLGKPHVDISVVFLFLFVFLQLVTRILNFLQPFVSTIFVGHLGNAELAGYALASAVSSF